VLFGIVNHPVQKHLEKTMLITAALFGETVVFSDRRLFKIDQLVGHAANLARSSRQEVSRVLINISDSSDRAHSSLS
jgi:hypothetical protein